MNNTTTQTAVIITGSGKIAATINGVSYTIDTDHPKYKQALDAVRKKDWTGFVNLVNISKQVENYFNGTGVEIYDGSINYHGQVIHNTLTKRILNFMQNDLPHEPLLNFFKNLMENPSRRAVNELYDFLEAGELPITEDGHFLAFKNVRSNYFDIHSGKFDNSVGKVCEMPRNGVDEDKDRTCSAGLHFCSISYLPSILMRTTRIGTRMTRNAPTPTDAMRTIASVVMRITESNHLDTSFTMFVVRMESL